MKKKPRDYKVNGQQYAYILDCIFPENIGVNPDGMTDRDKVELVLNAFNAEYNYAYNKIRNPRLTERFADWMRGLPSVFCVAFDNWSIAQIGKDWGYCGTEKETSDFFNNWWNSMTDKFFQLARRIDVDYTWLL